MGGSANVEYVPPDFRGLWQQFAQWSAELEGNYEEQLAGVQAQLSAQGYTPDDAAWSQQVQRLEGERDKARSELQAGPTYSALYSNYRQARAHAMLEYQRQGGGVERGDGPEWAETPAPLPQPVSTDRYDARGIYQGPIGENQIGNIDPYERGRSLWEPENQIGNVDPFDRAIRAEPENQIGNTGLPALHEGNATMTSADRGLQARYPEREPGAQAPAGPFEYPDFDAWYSERFGDPQPAPAAKPTTAPDRGAVAEVGGGLPYPQAWLAMPRAGGTAWFS